MILGKGKRFSEEIWKEIISQVDMNKDGEISYEEFEAMMLKFAS
jgi:Ca2+-binding EF-hand superfamily protein